MANFFEMPPKGNNLPGDQFFVVLKACTYYETRFTIETFFSDQKSRGFSTATADQTDVYRLLGVSADQFFWYLGIGDRFVRTNTSKSRRGLSLFQPGLRLLHYLAVRGFPIPYPRIRTAGYLQDLQLEYASLNHLIMPKFQSIMKRLRW